MSMRYEGIDDYGLLMKDEILTDELKDKIMDFGAYLGEFSGEIFKLLPDGRTKWDDNKYVYDCVYYLPLEKYPGLCTKPYESMDEVVKELKKNYKDIIPKGYDISGNIVHIIGTIYA